MSKLQPSQQQKIAEKLTILNQRGIGLLNRIYYIKKIMDDPKRRPALLSDPLIKPAIEYILKGFPKIDPRSNPKELNELHQVIKNDQHNSLKNIYLTYLDVLDFKEHVSDILSTIDSCQLKMTLEDYFDLTKNYLDLVTNYSSLMVLLSRVPDQRAVIGLHYCLNELNPCNRNDHEFQNLGEMVCNFEYPVKRLTDDFQGHVGVFSQALVSISNLYEQRTKPNTVDEWRTNKALSVISDPQNMVFPSYEKNPLDFRDCKLPIPCQYLSLDSMTRWVVIGSTLCHAQNPIPKLLTTALSDNFVITLYRDEIIYPHEMIESFFKALKGYGKRANEVHDCLATAVSTSFTNHRDRRIFLENALREQAALFAENPGLLGPKVLNAFMGLSYSCDEVKWMVRHFAHPMPKTSRGKWPDFKKHIEIAKLLFHIHEMKNLMTTYAPVTRKYYKHYMAQYDSECLNELVSAQITLCAEDESFILSDTIKTLHSLPKMDEDRMDDMSDIRLDWFRLQAYMTIPKPTLVMAADQKRKLCTCMNQISFHTKMVDALQCTIVETCDLSILFQPMYATVLNELFKASVSSLRQNLYSISFPVTCAELPHCVNGLCQEEKGLINDRTINLCNTFLEDLAKEATTCVIGIAAIHDKYDKSIKSAAFEHVIEEESKRGRKSSASTNQSGRRLRPGDESERRNMSDMTQMDILQQRLHNLCYTMSYFPVIKTATFEFFPSAFLVSSLEKHYAMVIVSLALDNDTKPASVRKPSECLSRVRNYMSIFQWIEDYVDFDTLCMIKTVFARQSHLVGQQHNEGEATLTTLYTEFYVNLLKKTDSLIYSNVSNRFVGSTTETSKSDEYTCPNELMALVQLIGPSGVRQLLEGLAKIGYSHLFEKIKQNVRQNRECLHQIRLNSNNPDRISEFTKQLRGTDDLLSSLITCGMSLAFHADINCALREVLSNRAQFVLTSINDFYEHAPEDPSSALSHHSIASIAGINCVVDPTIAASMAIDIDKSLDSDYNLFCLLLVYTAVALPELAKTERILYKLHVDGHANNAHCIAHVITKLVPVMFYSQGQAEISERLNEFLKLASLHILKLAQQEKVPMKLQEPVYILLGLIVDMCPQLTMNSFESNFPFVLLRNAYHTVYKK